MVDDVRRRVQNETTGHRGRKDDPLFKSRRLLLQGVEHLENKQLNKLRELLDAGDPEGAVTVAWHAYQDLRMIYHVKLTEGSTYFLAMLEKYSDCPIPEIKRLCKTLKNWKEEICAYFKTDGASNGPTEAINGVIETGIRFGILPKSPWKTRNALWFNGVLLHHGLRGKRTDAVVVMLPDRQKLASTPY